MPCFELVHNIIPPYRRHMFDMLAREFSSRGWSFFVHFMAKHHADRPSHWHADSQQLSFPHYFHSDYPLRSCGRRVHFNPGILSHFLLRRSDVLMVAGMDSITSAGALLMGRAKVKLYWTEGNPNKLGVVSGPVGIMKRMILRNCAAYAVPGQLSMDYVRKTTQRELGDAQFVKLPNLVDGAAYSTVSKEALLQIKKQLSELKIGDATPWAIWPARLSPEKGILEFLPIWAAAAPSDWHLVILGEGPLLADVHQLLDALGLRERVAIVPYVDTQVMPAWYASASLMLMPSINDANPLSVVEALQAGLPLVVSNRIGNWPEAIENHVNGVVADPFNHQEMSDAVRWATSLGAAARQRAQIISRERALAHWDSCLVVKRFVDAVVTLYEARV